MTFSFLHGGIALFGLASAAVPILIHLLLKQRPKPITFPAMQLIRNKRESTVRRMRLQHLLLMALRIALLVLIATALARPTLHSSLFSIDQKAPVAAAVIIDNSQSMQYRERGKTRLEVAKELAEQVIKKLPDQSKVTVFEAANPVGTVPLEIPGAIGQLETIQLQSSPRPLNEAIANAYKGLSKADLQRREVYVFTDLAGNSWNLNAQDRLEQLAGLIETGVRVYVIDVGAEEIENVAVTSVEVAQQITGSGDEVTITAPLRNTGSKPVDLNSIVLTIDGEPRHTRSARLEAGQTQEMVFSVSGLSEGIHQGAVSINAGDPLAFDDTRYFTLMRRPPVRVLIVVDLLSDALNWEKALVPLLQPGQGPARYDVQVITTPRLESTRLDDFNVVNLIHVGTLSQAMWGKLATFVQSGGGLFVAMGERIDAASYNSDLAQSILPAKLLDEAAAETVLSPARMNHPVLEKFRTLPHHNLDEYEVFRYRKLEIDDPNKSLVVIPYDNGDPALVERAFANGGRGRVLLWTTAAFRRGTNDWNDVPLGWAFLMLSDQVTRYLSGASESQFNYTAGSFANVELDPNKPLTLFTVTDPTGHVDRMTVEPRAPTLTLPSVRKLGHYQVEAKEGDRSFFSGFSVNEQESESELVRVDNDQLRKLLGEERTVVARSADSLDRAVDEARVGRELFPWLMILVMTVVCVEGFLANRFYRQPALSASTP